MYSPLIPEKITFQTYVHEFIRQIAFYPSNFYKYEYKFQGCCLISISDALMKLHEDFDDIYYFLLNVWLLVSLGYNVDTN